MRVLQVNKFYDLRGGTERILFDLESGLRGRGHEVAVFATLDERNEPTPWREYFARGRDYDHPGPRERLGNAIAAVYDRDARRRFSRLLDAFDPELVHLHNIYHQLSPSLLDELRERGIPAVMTLHDYKLVCPIYRLFRDGRPCEECVGRRVPIGVLQHRCSRKSWAESALLAVESSVHRLRRSYERSIQRFVAPSRFLRDVVLRHGLPPERVEVIENAPAEAIRPEPALARADRPTVLCAARISFEKGIDVLLEASRRVPSVELRIAGEGPELEVLRRRSADLPQVVWLGRLDAEALARERARSWAVALPSVWYENAPLAAIEALLAGRPLLAADHGGLREMVEEGRTGWRVPPGRVGAWAEVLEKVAGGAEVLAEMGERAAGDAAFRYDYERFLDRTLELYAGVVGASERAP